MAFKSAENTRKDSEAIRGCLSLSDFRRTGVITGSELENVGGECVANNKARKDRHVKCRVEVEVVGDCDKMGLQVDMI
jgi:hypothetical protein